MKNSTCSTVFGLRRIELNEIQIKHIFPLNCLFNGMHRFCIPVCLAWSYPTTKLHSLNDPNYYYLKRVYAH